MNAEQWLIINAFINGVVTMGHFTAGLFFLRFWKRLQDRLFLFFAAAFWLFGGIRLLTIFQADQEHPLYWLRLTGYLIILAAVADKNLRRQSSPQAVPPKGARTPGADSAHSI
jgi:hypothetical protein